MHNKHNNITLFNVVCVSQTNPNATLELSTFPITSDDDVNPVRNAKLPIFVVVVFCSKHGYIKKKKNETTKWRSYVQISSQS